MALSVHSEYYDEPNIQEVDMLPNPDNTHVTYGCWVLLRLLKHFPDEAGPS